MDQGSSMASTCRSQLVEDDLSEESLHIYLKDSTFVQYFNAFLMLPAFSSRLFFNGETGYFEQVHGEAVQAWKAGVEKVTPSNSMATLYLTDEAVGLSVDKQQSWEWVTRHRLPLFLKSDLFSEYKLCKLLTGRTHDGNIDEDSLKPHKSKSATRLSTGERGTGGPLRKGSSNSAVCLPSLGTQVQSPSSGSLLSTKHHGSVSASKSDIELGSKKKSVSSRQTHQHQQKVEKLSSEISCIVLEDVSPPDQAQTSSHKSSSSKVYAKMSAEDLAFLGTKSGMSSLWKFLKGTMGERNWLFWLDAEHVKYSTKPIDQQRLLREVRDRYLHSGSPLELPAETRNRLRVSKTTRLTLPQLKELQLFMLQGLRDYWCPRFILHCHSEEEALLLNPQFPSLSRSHSATPVVFPHQTVSGNSSLSLSPNYSGRATPFTPSRTPTFKRITSSPHRRAKSHGNATPTTRGRQLAASTVDVGSARHHESSPRPHTVTGNRQLTSSCVDGGGRCPSRRVWDKQSAVEGTGSPKGKIGSKMTSPARNNRRAKYTLQHLRDPNSRCASNQGLDHHPDSRDLCESRCQILSVSGTPLHSGVVSPQHYSSFSSEAYASLLHCLNAEQRKAGGYLQNHLETLENKSFLHCLQFWCEVQQYKALFVGASFSPCAVEKKAKTLYGLYIADGCDRNIDCPASVSSSVSSNLCPAYDDLFDAVEEHALSMLLLPWLELCHSEDSTFQELKVLSRRESLTCIIGLEDLDEEDMCIDDPHMFRSRSKSSARFLLHPPASPGSLRASSSRFDEAISLNDIMRNRTELEHFKIFLNEHLAAQDLMCWMEIEAFRGIPASDRTIRDIKAKQLRTNYFNKKYFFGPNSPATKEQQRQTVQAGGGGYGSRLPARPRTPVFREAQKHVRRRLEQKWLAEFMKTPEFIARNGGSLLKDAHKGKKMSMNSHSQAFVFERTFANSHEAILFRRVLQDKVQRQLLLRYLSIKQTPQSNSLMSFSRQNIEFWLEVQRYKEMCHIHTTDNMLQNKVTAIVDCYFQSSAPPKLQLNIPLNVAEEVTSKPRGPYVFRVAQAAVFKHLFTCWEEYQNFTSGYHSPVEVERALDQLQHQIQTSLVAEREQEHLLRKEQEQMRLTMPRFETEDEKAERLKREQELAEFGEISEAFRLSKPNPRYTYYTELPEDFYSEDMRMLRQKASNGISKVSEQQKRETKEPTNTDPQQRRNSYSNNQRTFKQGKLQKEDNSESPVIMMKLKRNPKEATKDQGSEEPTTVNFEDEVNARMSLKVERSHQQFFLERQTSRNFFHLKRASSRLIRRPTVKRRLNDMKYAPHSTINMRLSTEPASFELYGGGLPPEQSSHLSIINVTTS